MFWVAIFQGNNFKQVQLQWTPSIEKSNNSIIKIKIIAWLSAFKKSAQFINPFLR